MATGAFLHGTNAHTAAQGLLYISATQNYRDEDVWRVVPAIRGEVESLMVNDIVNSDYGDLPYGSAVENYELVWNRWLSGPGTYKYYEGGEVPRPGQITAENIARVVYERLEEPVNAAGSARLLRVRIHETRRNSFVYGEVK